MLFPLLGITNLLFAVNPGDKGDLEGAYMIANALLQSSQVGQNSLLFFSQMLVDVAIAVVDVCVFVRICLQLKQRSEEQENTRLYRKLLSQSKFFKTKRIIDTSA